MAQQQQGLNWLEFQQMFSSEQACRDYLFKMRWPDGFQCPFADIVVLMSFWG